jgi:uncharacterized protein YukE
VSVPDLKVDYDLLQACEANLQFVDDQFKGLHTQVHDLDSGSGWGASQIQDAMGQFSDNWNYHRGKLESAIEALLTMLKQTKDTFMQADEQLAKQLYQDAGAG